MENVTHVSRDVHVFGDVM